MDFAQAWFKSSINAFLNLPIFPDGEHKISVFMALHLIVLLMALFYATSLLRKWLIGGILIKFSRLDIGSRHALGTIISYVALGTGLLVILDTAGVDITIITVFAGALGLGISLSLQNIMSNFMSGLIILIERPIKVGDRVEVGNVVGEVADISLRSATILTSDNIAIIVPNSEFTSAKITNWSYNNKLVRFRLPVSVPRATDPDTFTGALLQIANEQVEVLQDPAPEVIFQSFSDNSQNFVLLVWCKDASHPDLLQSHLNYAISRYLNDQEAQLHTETMQATTISSRATLMASR